MRRDNRFDDIDSAALNTALLALKTCPRCRRDLQRVGRCPDVWGCATCRETWHLSGIDSEENPKDID